MAQSVYEFVEALDERREFICVRKDQIIAEIDNGMPKWESKPGQPWILTSVFGIPFPVNNWQSNEIFGRNFPFRNWKELVAFSRLVFLGALVLLCFLHLFSHRCSVHWYLQGLKKYLFFSGCFQFRSV